jgi:hypothetical protein
MSFSRFFYAKPATFPVKFDIAPALFFGAGFWRVRHGLKLDDRDLFSSIFLIKLFLIFNF